MYLLCFTNAHTVFLLCTAEFYDMISVYNLFITSAGQLHISTVQYLLLKLISDLDCSLAITGSGLRAILQYTRKMA